MSAILPAAFTIDQATKYLAVQGLRSTAYFDSIRFLMSSGNIVSGRFRVYGIRKGCQS